MPSDEHKLVVFYDGSCPFCTFSATRLKKLDWMNNLQIYDLYTPEVLQKYHIPYEEAILRIQVINKKQERKEGLEALLEISKFIPSLCFFLPIFWLTIKLGLGTKIYDWIARNRFLFPVPGYCPIPDDKGK